MSTDVIGSQTKAVGHRPLLKRCWCATQSLFAHKQPKAEMARECVSRRLPASKQEARECLSQVNLKIRAGDINDAALLLAKAAYGFTAYPPYDPDRGCVLLCKAAKLYRQHDEWENAAKYYTAAADMARAWAEASKKNGFALREKYFLKLAKSVQIDND